jgi:hypothetical protein
MGYDGVTVFPVIAKLLPRFFQDLRILIHDFRYAHEAFQAWQYL